MEKNTKKDWFKFEGIPKPIRWQGWACHGIFLLSFFLLARLMIVYDVNSWILTIILAIAILLFLTVAILKSNFREMTQALKMKEQKKQLYIRMGVTLGVLLLLQGIYMIQLDNKIGYIIIILGAILIYIYFKYRKNKVSSQMK